MTAEPTFTSGRTGDKVRGDLWLGFTPDSTSPVAIDFESRLAGMYGEQTLDLLGALLAEAEVKTC